ncbi:MAG: NAD(P)/FAD-dependent oxidoreductase [Kosmotoga sp.]|nr:MAG: NAD(P)/FAD-dependent oxidoreductase [Kosmotoga sp.]
MERYNLAIAGAGSAGIALALKSVSRGLKVALVDVKSREELGYDWADSIDEKALMNDLIGYKKSEEVTRPMGLKVISPKFSTEFRIEYGYKIIDRRALMKRLISKAEDFGVDVFLKANSVRPLLSEEMLCTGLAFKQGEKDFKVNAELVADCTGLSGAIKSLVPFKEMNMPLRKTDTSTAYREIRKWSGESDAVEKQWVTFVYGINGGFSWIVPETNERIDIGYGIQNGKNYPSPETLVRQTVNKLGLKDYIKGGGGKIPICSSPPILYMNGLLLVGDSACQTIPTCGYGTGNAIQAGFLAGECMAKSNLSPDERGRLYEERYFKERGADLGYLDILRRKLQSYTPENIDWLMKKKIIGYEELYSSINGTYNKTTFLSSASKLMKGITNIGLIMDLKEAIDKAEKFRNKLLTISKKKEDFQEWMTDYFDILSEVNY